MDRANRRRIDREILKIIECDICEEFKNNFERCHRITSEIPLEPSNEIRNAIDHLGKCIAEEGIEEAKRHITNAKAHVMIASVDCLLKAIIARMTFVDDAIGALEADEYVPPLKNRRGLLQTVLRARGDARTIRDQISQIGPIPIVVQTSIEERETANLREILAQVDGLGSLLAAYNNLYEVLRDAIPLEQLIAVHARGKWERAGKPAGRDNEFWCEAEAQLRQGRT
jgi:hypothetical protein